MSCSFPSIASLAFRSPGVLCLRDLSFDFSCPSRIELLLVRREFAEQSEKLPGVHTLFVGYVLEHFDDQLVVSRLRKLLVQLSGLVLRGHHETNRSDELLACELPVARQPGKG